MPKDALTPQARHHFTRFDQIDQLVGTSEADADLGFMARLMALCSLPRTNPGDALQYARRNGPYSLTMIAGANNKLPYGNIPRLLIAWVCTEAVQTQDRVLTLGRSLGDFMRKLQIYDSGGNPQLRLRNQMQRLFRSHVQLVYQDKHEERFVSSAIADRGEFWWDPKRPDETMLWESTIRLGEDFFNEIVSHPVPLDMNVLRAIKRSTLALDLYTWLTYKTFVLTRPEQLSWKKLYRQFGARPDRSNDIRTVDNFRTDCLRELKKINLAWPEFNYDTAKSVLSVESLRAVDPAAATVPPLGLPKRSRSAFYPCLSSGSSHGL